MATTNPYKILIVEDEGLIACDIASRLEAMGHQVTSIVSTAKEAVNEASAADIVLMDIRLDGPGDGIQAAEIIRRHYAKPVVFLTAHADRSTLERAKQAVPFGYVVKPVQSATLAATLDVAVHKHRIEQELAEQRGLLDAVLASVTDAIIVAGPAGNIRMLNRAAEVLTGWTASEANGRPIVEVLPLFAASSVGHAEDPVPLALLRGEPIEIGNGMTLALRNGRRVTVEGSAAPVHTNDVLAGVVVNLRDVSSRDWTEKQLRLSQKMAAAANLASVVSDEYANILSVIRGRAGTLIEQFPEYVVVRGALEEIEQAAVSGEKLTRRLAGLGARQLLNREMFSLNGMLRRTRKLIESIAGEHVSLTVQMDPAARKVWADSAQIEQVLMNLVIHASAASSKTDLRTGQEPRRLKIETGNAEVQSPGGAQSFVRLAVWHSGVEPEAEAMFDPSPLEDGRMALAITHNIVTQHGGYLSAFPVPEGFCFEVLLPKYAEPESDPAAAIAGAVPGILLVESNESLRRELQNFFEAHGYSLLEASDEAEAVTLADLHDGSLDLAIVPHSAAEALAGPLGEGHPGLKILEIVAPGAVAISEPSSNAVIERPFTQTALLDKVRGLLGMFQESHAAVAG